MMQESGLLFSYPLLTFFYKKKRFMQIVNNNTETTEQQIQALEKRIMESKKQLASLRQKLPPQTITENYTFQSKGGETVTLAQLFGDKQELILVYNMGRSCSYCTLWADGLNGLTNHLNSRAAFVVVSPDLPEEQTEFATARNWQFALFSHQGSDFVSDMGFKAGEYYLPGVSIFLKDEKGVVYHHTKAHFGPDDNYCIMWDFLNLLPSGLNKWVPKLNYEEGEK